MQPDGNLATYNNYIATWSIGTVNNLGAFLLLQDNGNVAIYREWIWYGV
jgi:hypothetical protein